MELTRKQEEGLKIAVARYKALERYTVISGYAGTGKSTLINHIIYALNLDPDFDVAYMAYTGKASEVLRRKGCVNAMTGHKLLYHSVKTPSGHFITTPKKFIGEFKIIVVDEVSMLPKKMWDLLLRHGIHVLACGDPGQLPPIAKKGEEPLTILDNPHIFLDEVMRQAAESDIIRLSMDIREHKPIPFFKGTEAMVIPYSEVDASMYKWASQILTATNATRRTVNDAIRAMDNRGPQPEVGDKVISLANHWDIFSETGDANLINGTIGYLTDPIELKEISYPVYTQGFPRKIPICQAGFISEVGDDFGVLNMDHHAINVGQPFLNSYQEYVLYKAAGSKENFPQIPLEFNYGYAITVHRAQGSEWDKVLVLEERFPFDAEEHTKWLYTAVTRAQNRLVLVR